MYLLLLIPTWLMIQLFGVPIEVGWIMLQSFWWLIIQSWNFSVYQLVGLYQAIGALFAVSVYIGYENQKFQTTFRDNVASNIWAQFFIVWAIILLWPLALFVGWFLWND